MIVSMDRLRPFGALPRLHPVSQGVALGFVIFAPLVLSEQCNRRISL